MTHRRVPRHLAPLLGDDELTHDVPRTGRVTCPPVSPKQQSWLSWVGRPVVVVQVAAPTPCGEEDADTQQRGDQDGLRDGGLEWVDHGPGLVEPGRHGDEPGDDAQWPDVALRQVVAVCHGVAASAVGVAGQGLPEARQLPCGHEGIPF